MDLEACHQLLRNHKIKSTDQRKEILCYIAQQAHIHPTAQQIHDAVVRKYASTSLGNVYHNLSLFEEKKVVRKIVSGDAASPSRYEIVEDHSHLHIVCTECGSIEDVYTLRFSEKMKHLIFQETRYQLHEFQSNLSGICLNCIEKTD